jgi:glycosyltransferase involved in cell wall biosynthesis
MSLRLSVVIPMYKASPWIEATLQSVVSQTYAADQLEILAIDDASPDDSAEVASAFLSKQPHQSRVVRQASNGGLLATRNAGLRLAGGEWIQFLDQDDLLSSDKLRLQAGVAASAGAEVAVVYSPWQYLRLEGGRWQPSGPIHAPFVDDDPLLQILEDFNFANVGPTLIRRATLESVGGFSPKPNLGEDLDLMLKLARSGAGFRSAPSDTPGFLFRQLSESLASSYSKDQVAMRNLLETLHAVEEHWRQQAPETGLSPRQRQALASRYSRFADFYEEHDPPSHRALKGWLTELDAK